MIKDVFIPEKVGNYYIFPQRIISIDITKTHIYGCKVTVQGTHLSVINMHKQSIESEFGNNHKERTVFALKTVLQKLGKYDLVYASVPGVFTIFKTLKFPFSDYEKIKMVVPYEIEPLLPFSLDDTVVDFFITTLFEDGSCQVLVVAVQKQHVAQQSNLFAQADVKLALLSVDALGIYHVYKRIPEYANIRHACIIIDYRMHETRLIYLRNGHIMLTRTLAKGFFDQAKNIGARINLSPTAVAEQLLRFGFEQQAHDSFSQTSNQILGDFFKELSFTITSFSSQGGSEEKIDKVLLLGDVISMKGIERQLSHALGIPVHIFHVQDLLHDTQLTFKNNLISQEYMISFGTALSALEKHPVNLLQAELGATEHTLIKQQLVSAFLLTIGIFLSLIGYTYYQVSRLKAETYASTQQAIKSLQDAFNNKLKVDKKKGPQQQLASVIESAKEEVQEKKKLWSSFAGSANSSFLPYLLELTTKLDKKGLGLQVERIILDQEKLSLKGSVQNYESAKLLEQAFKQSRLFGAISPLGELEKLSFNAEIELHPTGDGEE
jgi:Tfp pilus assembly PilM family ATPase